MFQIGCKSGAKRVKGMYFFSLEILATHEKGSEELFRKKSFVDIMVFCHFSCGYWKILLRNITSFFNGVFSNGSITAIFMQKYFPIRPFFVGGKTTQRTKPVGHSYRTIISRKHIYHSYRETKTNFIYTYLQSKKSIQSVFPC